MANVSYHEGRSGSSVWSPIGGRQQQRSDPKSIDEGLVQTHFEKCPLMSPEYSRNATVLSYSDGNVSTLRHADMHGVGVEGHVSETRVRCGTVFQKSEEGAKK